MSFNFHQLVDSESLPFAQAAPSVAVALPIDKQTVHMHINVIANVE